MLLMVKLFKSYDIIKEFISDGSWFCWESGEVIGSADAWTATRSLRVDDGTVSVG